VKKPQSLNELIDLAVERHDGASGRELEDIARRGGHKIVHTTINQIRNGTYKSNPSLRTLRALAWLAGVPERVALEAAGRKPKGRPFADDLPPGVDELGLDERRVAIALLRTLVAQQQRIDQLEEQGKAEDLDSPDQGFNVVELRREEEDDAAVSTSKPSTVYEEGRKNETQEPLASRAYVTRERRRRQVETEPGEHPDPDGPENGA